MKRCVSWPPCRGRPLRLSRVAGEVAERSDAGEGRLITLVRDEPPLSRLTAFADLSRKAGEVKPVGAL